MNPSLPEPFYPEIMADFGWSEVDDQKSAVKLHALLPSHDTFRHVGTELKHRPLVTVVGCGPSLDNLTMQDLQGIVIAADGAAGRLQELGVVPRIVVTDLDGGIEGLQWAADNGAAMVVHAHGDNQDSFGAVEGFPIACGTYQSAPDDALRPMRNVGGFTDGDRAVMLCQAYGVKQVNLVAFDLDSEPSAWSGKFNQATKARKLGWAKRILKRVAAEGSMRIVHAEPLRP
jgi:uncharacterized Rossmann fold enzyme